MSGQIKLKAASLGGDITLKPTDTASNLVVTIPAGTSTLVTNATLPTQLNATGSAPIFACRAWVNFNGTGTVAIRGSGNVSSITDNGTGDYTVNFTTALQDVNYAAVCNTVVTTATNINFALGPRVTGILPDNALSTYSTTAVQVIGKDSGGTSRDPSLVTVSIFR